MLAPGRLRKAPRSAATRRVLGEAAERNARRLDAEPAAGVQAVLERLGNDLAKESERARSAFGKQRGFAAYTRELHALVSGDARPDRASGIERLQARHRDLLGQAFQAAAVIPANLGRMLAAGLRPFGEIKVTVEPPGNIQVDFGPEPDLEAVAEPTSFTLEPPYDDDSSSTRATNLGLVPRNNAEASAEDGRVLIDGAALLGGRASNRAIVGEFVTVSPGFSKLKVSAFVAAFYYQIGAVGTPGIAESSAHGIVELTDQDGQTRRERKLIARAVAPLIGWNIKEGSRELVVTKTFDLPTVPAAGADVLVRAGVESSCGGLAGAASAYVDAGVTRIVIEPLP